MFNNQKTYSQTHQLKNDNLLDTLLDATQQLLNDTVYNQTLYKSIEIMGSHLGFDQIQVYTFNSLNQIDLLFKWNKQIIRNINLQGNELFQQLSLNDVLIQDDLSEGLQSSLFIPIKFDHVLHGFIEFYQIEKRLLTKDTIQLLQIYTNTLGLSLARMSREKEFEQISYRDSLTNLYSRRFFEQEFNKLATNDNLPFSILVADINGLKLVNDSFGHIQGDALIRLIASILKNHTREQDILCRWGGDEFTILLPKTNNEEAGLILRDIIEETKMSHLDFIPVSISIAHSTVTSGDINLNKLFIEAEDLMYKKKMIESPIIKKKIIQSVVHTLNARSAVEEKHSKKVSELCAQIGQALNFDEFGIKHLRDVGLYHDIGKIAISKTILNKLDHLNKQEYEEFKKHPEIGYRILSTITEMADIADFILKHHERIDGNGFPYGLKGEEIPLITRILTVADAYEAMSAKYPFQNDLVIQELIKNSCNQFDYTIVRVLVEKVLKKPWYSALYGVNNTVIKYGEEFDPLKGVFVIDPLDSSLSVKDINLTGLVNNKVPGNYEIIYTIVNKLGKMERISRIIAVGELTELNLIEYTENKWEKVEIDGALFNHQINSNEIQIHLASGGSNSWSAQLIYKGIPFEKNKYYVLSFDAYNELPKKEMQLSIGMLDEDNNYWNSFVNTTSNKFYFTPFKQTYKLMFRMEKDTCLDSELKFEFGTGEKTNICISNLKVFEFNN